jgi:hypothetical protein
VGINGVASSPAGFEINAIARENASHFERSRCQLLAPKRCRATKMACLPLSDNSQEAAIQPFASSLWSAGYKDPVSTFNRSSDVR